MQQESYVFLIMIIAESEETALESNELAAYFSAQVGEGHSGTGEMVGEEAYTGGLWEFFPPAGHDLYAGLIAGGDTVVFPVESA
jgi:hypothetical protein